MAPVGICSTARETSDGTPLREANERTVSLACRAPRSRSGTGLRRWGSTVYVRSSVGRQSEIRRLEELVEAVRAGRSRAVAGLLRPVRRALATACRLRRPAAAGETRSAAGRPADRSPPPQARSGDQEALSRPWSPRARSTVTNRTQLARSLLVAPLRTEGAQTRRSATAAGL